SNSKTASSLNQSMLFNQLPVHISEATSLRVAGFEDEDDDENENDDEAPGQGGRHPPILYVD
ncbi:MAG TPA: hypothetical protein VN939_18525, partial [Chthoniobacterales bacterium]|nr:hypothetical protein [Chthoniobacterales bacterium]